MEILQARILEWVAMPSSRGLPNSRTEPRSPPLQVDFLLSKPPGNPKNTGVDSLSLLQGNFLTQESHRGLLYCTQIIYQLSYQESPIFITQLLKNLPAMQETLIRFLGREDPLEKG